MLVVNNHINYEQIVSLIKSSSRVMDLGCGNGDLLKRLKQEKMAHVTGVDISEANIIECIKKGISVVHSDIDAGLKDFKDKTYDYVILSQTIQVVQKPLYVLKEMLRVGNTAIVSFPNFGYWKIRLRLFFKGKMPVTKSLPYEWYDTPNIHLATIKDMQSLCKKNNLKIKNLILLSNKREKLVRKNKGLFYNFFASECIMVIEE
jgi:methionine biosynthesis protein MetW